MYELCMVDKLAEIRRKNAQILNLEDAMCELYKLFELSYILINGNFRLKAGIMLHNLCTLHIIK